MPTVPLYHYTRGENLIKIVESQELWATQISCLNDTTELTYSASEFRKRIIEKLSGVHDERAEPLLLRLAEILVTPEYGS